MSKRLDPLFRAEREAKVIEMRGRRCQWKDIAAEIGVTVGRAYQIYDEALERIPAQKLRTVREETQQLADAAINNLLTIARGEADANGKFPSANARVLAWTEIRQWNESLRKLYGADAPSRKEVTVLTDDAVDAAIRKLGIEMDEAAKKLEEIEALESEAVSSLRELGEEI